MTKQLDIYEFSRLAAVSTATVSRAFAPNSKISDKTRQRVLTLAQQLNYAPNVHARRLAGERTGVIGVVFFNQQKFFDYFALELIREISLCAARLGYSILLEGPAPEEARAQVAERMLALVRGKAIDGLIILGCSYDAGEHEVLRLVSDFPAVVIGAGQPAAPLKPDVVCVDFCQGIRETLPALRLRKLPALLGAHSLEDSKLQTYLTLLREAGIIIPPERIGCCTPEDSSECAKQLLERGCDCLLCLTDRVGAAAIRRCRHAGRSIPGDVWVIGMDNLEFSAMLSPTLSTIAIPLAQLAETTLTRLTERIATPEAIGAVIELPTRYIARESTDQN